MNDIDTQDRDGVGRTLIRKMEDEVDDRQGFRTRILKEPGREIMLRTKGGSPEVTEKRAPAEGCIKGPLTEIAFKYVNPTAITGYRRWYGEPDPAVGTPEKVIKYEWSSDGLFCMEARKLQKIACKDANAQPVDILFAERPEDDTIPPEDLPAVDPAAAGSTARFKLIEGKYTEREWYRNELANIGWAFSGPTIAGNPDPEPASAVKFFIRRLRSIMFSVSDTLGKIAASKIKWIFANQTYINRTLGAATAACVNQNARELSFTGRSFFTPSTDGNMDKITMSVGIDEPPETPGGPSFTVNFKKPGSFIAAIDPEGAVGNTRPAEVAQAIDLCAFSSFGNPYHGLIWKTGASATVLYTDSTRTAQWPFTPSAPLGGYDERTHRYYNVSGKSPLLEENQIKTSVASDGVLYPDALIYAGAWYVKDPDFLGWGQLLYFEWLYKDPAGTVWVMKYEVTNVERAYNPDSSSGTDDALVTIRVTLMRRFGVLGTEFSGTLPESNTINRVIGTVTMVDHEGWISGAGFILVLAREYSFICSPDAKQVMVMGREFIEDFNENAIMSALLVTMSGTGAVKTDVENEIAIGDGITIAAEPFPVSIGLVSQGAVITHFNTLELYYDEGQWNTIDATRTIDYNYSPNWLYSITFYKNGYQLFTVSSLTHSLYIFPICAVPEEVASGAQQIPDSNNKPLAWTVGRAWGYYDSIPTYMQYHGVVLPIDQADAQPYVDGGKTYTASFGWAYDYRTRELITVPFGTVAFFI